MPLPQTTITGVGYLRMGGALADNRQIQVLEARKPGTLLVTDGYENGMTNASGEIKASDGTSPFKLPRNSEVKLSAPIVGMDRHGGEWFVIPDVDTIDIAILIAVASVPSRGLTIRDNDVPLSSLIGDFDFVGFTVEQVSPGKARLTNSGGTPHNLLSATHSDSIAAAVVRGDLITGQGATPKWTRLVKGASGTYLRSDGTDLAYSAIAASDLPSGIDAAKISGGLVSNTEFDFLNGVTSSIQDQINSQLTQAEADVLYSVLAHTHTGVYEPANANIQSHISSTSNPHAVTKTQVGLGSVDNIQQQPISARLTEVASIGTALQQIRVNAGGLALEYFTPSSGGAAAWGAITGTLSAQTDLQSALDAKQASDVDLDALAALSTTGFVKRTGAGAFAAAALVAGDIPDISATYEVIDANITRLGSSIDLSGAEATGVLAAGRFPALTGDVTTTAGALATTIAAEAITDSKVNASGITTRSKLPSLLAYEDETNIFTVGQIIDLGSLGSTSIDGLIFRNDTPATALAPIQNPPLVLFEAHGWDIENLLDVEWEMNERFQINPGNTSKARFAWEWSQDGGPYELKTYIDESGGLWSASYIETPFGFITGTLAITQSGFAFNDASVSVSNINTTAPFRFQSSNTTVTAFRFNAANTLTSGNLFEGLVPDSGFTGSLFKLGRSSDGLTITTTLFEVNASGALALIEQTAPATPASGYVAIYAKSDGKIYRKDDAGTEAELGGGAGGSQSPWTSDVDADSFNLLFDDSTGIKSSEAGNPELLLFASVESAVNELTVTNAATGNSPIVSATGGDTDIHITATPKGAGLFKVGDISLGVRTLPGVWLTSSTPSLNNGALFGNGNDIIVNAASGGSIDFRINIGAEFMIQNGVFFPQASGKNLGKTTSRFDNVFSEAINVTTFTPSGSADSAGATGEIRWDASFIYVKTAAGVWKRAALSTF